MPNVYSKEWFSLFLSQPDPAATAAEAAFVLRLLHLMQPAAPALRLLDLCCGYGRHALPLAAGGCQVVGIDRDAGAIAAARAAAAERAAELPPGCTPEFLRMDMRDISRLTGPFDAAICLWHSFGYFTPAQNRTILLSLARLLRPGGTLILDVYNRDFMQAHTGTRRMHKNGLEVTEQVRREGSRFFVSLAYGGAGTPDDAFEWELYTPRELAALGGSCGLTCTAACERFDERRPVSGKEARMQLMFKKAVVPMRPEKKDG